MHHCWHLSGACRRGTRVFRIGIHGGRVALRRRLRLRLPSSSRRWLWVVKGWWIINLRLRLLHTLSVVNGACCGWSSHIWHCYWLVYRWRLRLRRHCSLRRRRRRRRLCSIGWLGGHRIAYGRVSCKVQEKKCSYAYCAKIDKLDERWWIFSVEKPLEAIYAIFLRWLQTWCLKICLKSLILKNRNSRAQKILENVT